MPRLIFKEQRNAQLSSHFNNSWKMTPLGVGAAVISFRSVQGGIPTPLISRSFEKVASTGNCDLYYRDFIGYALSKVLMARDMFNFFTCLSSINLPSLI